MNKIDGYLKRKLTKRDKEELGKILKLKNELAAQSKSLSLRDYGFRPDGSRADRTMGEVCNKMGLVSNRVSSDSPGYQSRTRTLSGSRMKQTVPRNLYREANKNAD